MKSIRYFILCAGLILLAAALTRFLIAVGNAQIMALPDPMLGISLRYALFIVGAIELAAALICLFGKRVGFQIALLAWLGTNYLVVWIGLVWQHCSPQATCIGSLTDPLHLSRGLTGFILQTLPLGLLLGSYAALVQLWLAKRIKPAMQFVADMPGTHRTGAAVQMRSLKISCTVCGGHVEFPTNLLGEKIHCPHCQSVITLQKSRNMKMSCTACDGHLEFPDHAIGQTIPCPHCKTNITLTGQA